MGRTTRLGCPHDTRHLHEHLGRGPARVVRRRLGHRGRRGHRPPPLARRRGLGRADRPGRLGRAGRSRRTSPTSSPSSPAWSRRRSRCPSSSTSPRRWAPTPSRVRSPAAVWPDRRDRRRARAGRRGPAGLAARRAADRRVRRAAPHARRDRLGLGDPALQPRRRRLDARPGRPACGRTARRHGHPRRGAHRVGVRPRVRLRGGQAGRSLARHDRRPRRHRTASGPPRGARSATTAGPLRSRDPSRTPTPR